LPDSFETFRVGYLAAAIDLTTSMPTTSVPATLNEVREMALPLRKQGDFPRKTGKAIECERAITVRNKALRQISPKANNREKQGENRETTLWKQGGVRFPSQLRT
jgi:hypothetical protein